MTEWCVDTIDLDRCTHFSILSVWGLTVLMLCARQNDRHGRLECTVSLVTVSLVSHVRSPIFSTSYNSNKHIIRKLLISESQQ